MIPLMWLACHPHPAKPELPLDQAALEVLATLDLAVDRATRGDPDASEDCRRAYQRFEQDLEPQLRKQVSPEDVLAIEYAFSRVGAALTEGRSAGAEIEALADRLTSAARAKKTASAR